VPSLFSATLVPFAFTNVQGDAVFSAADLVDLKADARWAEGAVWTLQATASSTCTSNSLTFAFSYGGGTHAIAVPASADKETITVVDELNAFYNTTFFQARSVCTTPASGAVVTFHAFLVVPGYARTQHPTTASTETSAPTLFGLQLSFDFVDSPTPAPSASPEPSPTMLPAPAPTGAHEPAPTSLPASLPSTPPVPAPTFSIEPTPSPSPKPTPEPTQQPTLAPTVADTATISFTFSVSADAAPTATQKEALKSTIASSLGYVERNLTNFAVSTVTQTTTQDSIRFGFSLMCVVCVVRSCVCLFSRLTGARSSR
jgi:hypothetical protein